MEIKPKHAIATATVLFFLSISYLQLTDKDSKEPTLQKLQKMGVITKTAQPEAEASQKSEKSEPKRTFMTVAELHKSQSTTQPIPVKANTEVKQRSLDEIIKLIEQDAICEVYSNLRQNQAAINKIMGMTSIQGTDIDPQIWNDLYSPSEGLFAASQEDIARLNPQTEVGRFYQSLLLGDLLDGLTNGAPNYDLSISLMTDLTQNSSNAAFPLYLSALYKKASRTDEEILMGLETAFNSDFYDNLTGQIGKALSLYSKRSITHYVLALSTAATLPIPDISVAQDIIEEFTIQTDRTGLRGVLQLCSNMMGQLFSDMQTYNDADYAALVPYAFGRLCYLNAYRRLHPDDKLELLLASQIVKNENTKLKHEDFVKATKSLELKEGCDRKPFDKYFDDYVRNN